MTEDGKKHFRSIKIYNLNLIVFVVSCILYVLLVVTTINVSVRYHLMVEAMEEYVRCEEKALLLKDTSDHLTEQVRLYVVTKDITYANNYFMELGSVQRMHHAMDYLRDRDISDEAYFYIMEAKEMSDRLIQKEVYAISLVAHSSKHSLKQYTYGEYDVDLFEEDLLMEKQEILDKAAGLVFDSDYQKSKEIIRQKLDSFLKSIRSETHSWQQESIEKMEQIVARQHIQVGLLFGVNMIVFGMVILLVIRPLQIYARNIREEKIDRKSVV